jgi:hypothetical protein
MEVQDPLTFEVKVDDRGIKVKNGFDGRPSRFKVQGSMFNGKKQPDFVCPAVFRTLNTDP